MNAWGKSAVLGERSYFAGEETPNMRRHWGLEIDATGFGMGVPRPAIRDHRQERCGDTCEYRSPGGIQGLRSRLRVEAAVVLAGAP